MPLPAFTASKHPSLSTSIQSRILASASTSWSPKDSSSPSCCSSTEGKENLILFQQHRQPPLYLPPNLPGYSRHLPTTQLRELNPIDTRLSEPIAPEILSSF